MKHVDESIPLYLYDELDQDERQQFEVHIKDCQQCQAALDKVQALHNTLEQKPILEPSDSLLTKCRSLLKERLRQNRKANLEESWWTKLLNSVSMVNPLAQLAAAAAILILGIFIGRFGFTINNDGFNTNNSSQDFFNPVVSNVDFIQYDPNSGNIAVQYKIVQAVSLQGKIDDPAIRKILVHTIRAEEHPGKRLKAVKAVAGKRFSDRELEDALIFAMENDSISGVRLKAAQVLGGFPINQSIKNAFIRVLLHDPNSAIRMEALGVLEELVEDGDITPILQGASRDDENEYIRLKASKKLERRENPFLYRKEEKWN